MATGRITRVRTVAGGLAATGSGGGSGTATLNPQINLSATGTGGGTGSATAVPTFLLAGSGSGSGSGTATLVPTVALSASGSGSGSGTAVLHPTTIPLAATGSGSGDGTATLGPPTFTLAATGTGQGDGTATLTDLQLHLDATGSGSGDGTATLERVIDQAQWRDITITATVLESPWSATVLDSPWRATVEAPVKMSSATTDFYVIRIESREVPLDMAAPYIGFAKFGYPTESWPGAWRGNSNLIDETDETKGYFRLVELLIGPESPYYVTSPGTFTSFYDLRDNPTRSYEPAGRLYVEGPVFVPSA